MCVLLNTKYLKVSSQRCIFFKHLKKIYVRFYSKSKYQREREIMELPLSAKRNMENSRLPSSTIKYLRRKKTSRHDSYKNKLIKIIVDR
jgi:hypothetical protein